MWKVLNHRDDCKEIQSVVLTGALGAELGHSQPNFEVDVREMNAIEVCRVKNYTELAHVPLRVGDPIPLVGSRGTVPFTPRSSPHASGVIRLRKKKITHLATGLQ